MRAATAMAKETVHASAPRAGQWWEFERTLAGRNFVRAVALARELGVDAERVKGLQRDALRQFLAEYRNFQGASKLLADYGFTASELQELSEELLQRKELASERTFAWQAGKPTTLSVAEQIRNFAQTVLRSRRRRKVLGWWKSLRELGRTWTEQLAAL